MKHHDKNLTSQNDMIDINATEILKMSPVNNFQIGLSDMEIDTAWANPHLE